MFDKLVVCDFCSQRFSDREIALDYVLSFLTIPYKFGGDDFSGIDCSGIVVEYCKALGKIERNSDYTAEEFYNLFTHVKIPYRGALVYWENESKAINHVAIMLNERLCIEAGGGDKTTLTVSDAINRNAFVRIRNIHSRKGLAGFNDPFL